MSGPFTEVPAVQPGVPDDGHQWVEVRFYAQVPLRQVVLDVDPAEVAATLMRSFGYTRIAGLRLAVARRPEPLPPLPVPGVASGQ